MRWWRRWVSGGKVCVFTFAEANVLVDVNGYIPAGSDVVSLSPARLLDSRVGGATVDGQFAGGGRRGAGSVTEVVVAGRGGVPSRCVGGGGECDVGGDGCGGVCDGVPVWWCGAGCVESELCGGSDGGECGGGEGGCGGKVCVFTFAEANVLVDVNGYIPLAAPLASRRKDRAQWSGGRTGPVAGAAAAFARPPGATTRTTHHHGRGRRRIRQDHAGPPDAGQWCSATVDR